jgi:hypothetical protein
MMGPTWDSGNVNHFRVMFVPARMGMFLSRVEDLWQMMSLLEKDEGGTKPMSGLLAYVRGFQLAS